MGEASQKVIQMASMYVGNAEVTANDAPWLRRLMEQSNPTHWKPGESYCIAALCSLFAIVDPHFPIPYSKGTQQFYINALSKRYTSPDPQIGDIAIFRLGNSASGHAGIVTAVRPEAIDTIEFNTSNSNASDQRNGEGVYQKTRLFKHFEKTDDHRLWIRGYVRTSSL